MIALPAEQWQVFGSMSAQQLAKYLHTWATTIDMEKIKKASPRKPTKQKTQPIQDTSPHLSTARLLQEAKTFASRKPTSGISNDPTVNGLDAVTKRKFRQIKLELPSGSGRLSSLAISPDNKFLAAELYRGSLRFHIYLGGSHG